MRLYVRVKADKCRDCLKAKAEELFGELQLLGRNGEADDELAFITPFASEKQLMAQLAKLNGTVLSTIRLLD